MLTQPDRCTLADAFCCCWAARFAVLGDLALLFAPKFIPLDLGESKDRLWACGLVVTVPPMVVVWTWDPNASI